MPSGKPATLPGRPHARNSRSERVSATGRLETRLFMRDYGTSYP
jgi:hypothetical protein